MTGVQTCALPICERQNALKCVLESMRLVINQRLARSTDGKRTALREFLIFNGSIRDRLSRATPEEWTQVTKQCVEEHGQSFRMAIEKAFQAGRISEQTAAHELREIE